MKVKVCGLRRPEDIEAVNEYKPDYAGFILSAGFKRTVGREFYELEGCLADGIRSVGVFVNESLENIVENYAGVLDIIQLHGDEDYEYISRLRSMCGCEIWKAVRAKSCADIENACAFPVDKLLIDSYCENQYGGTGRLADFSVIKNADIKIPFFLAGGLDCSNVKAALMDVRPYGADVSGGVETDGFKDREKIRKFINVVRSV